MNFTLFKDRITSVIQIADDMAAAASSMNSQNYEILIQCRENLMRKMELWAEEDIARHGVFEKLKKNMIEFEEVGQGYNENK
jgi:oligoribonuclease (3'-5' exoribonuclease)